MISMVSIRSTWAPFLRSVKCCALLVITLLLVPTELLHRLANPLVR
jgi:hypothetical protein